MAIPISKQVTEEYPWIPPDAIHWLARILQPSWTVLETGMGGSTLFFAQRVAWVISYEHDARFFDRTSNLVKSVGSVDLRFRHEYPTAGLGSDLPPIDLAFIDGRGRVRSVIDVLPHMVPGGWLVLDDAEREHYEEARCVASAASSERLTFQEDATLTMAWRIR